MRVDLSDQLLADWNYYRLQTHHVHELREKNVYVKAKKMDAGTREVLNDMREWCATHSLEPRLWIFALFKLRQWMYAPKLTHGCLLSTNLIPKYKRMSGIGFFRLRRRVTQRQDREDDMFDPNRDLSPAVEGIKRQFVQTDNAGTCMAQMLDRTLGWHPKSPVCLGCPVACECAIRLCGLVRFNVLALRRGKITTQQAQATVEAQQ